LKTALPLRRPAQVMVLLDADMIVTRQLTELVDTAASGRVVAFRNDRDRFVPEWGELLDLGPVRRQPYLSSGFLAAARLVGEPVLRLMQDRQARVDFELTYWRRNVADYPFLYGDQCVLNAILASCVEPEQIVALENRFAANPPFRGLRVLDERSLRCAYDDGTEPYLIHHFTAKPWLESTFEGVYSQLLRRLLSGPGLAVRVPRSWLPLRMRSGPFAYANRKLINAREQVRWRVTEPLSERAAALRGSGSPGSGI
jgi:lipopolysaccharide biosynthesis glycosyltransferase